MRTVRAGATRKWAEWSVPHAGPRRYPGRGRRRVAGHVVGRQMRQGLRIWGIGEVEKRKNDAIRLQVRQRGMDAFILFSRGKEQRREGEKEAEVTGCRDSSDQPAPSTFRPVLVSGN